MKNIKNPQDTFNNAIDPDTNDKNSNIKEKVNRFTVPELEKIINEKQKEIKDTTDINEEEKRDEFPGNKEPEEFIQPEKLINQPENKDEKKNR